MPYNVQKTTNQYRHMCGFKKCTLMDFYHSAYIQYQSRILIKLNQKVDQLPEGYAPNSIANTQHVLYYIEVHDSEGNTIFPRQRDVAVHLL